ncbi:MAG: cobalamin-binding protein [Cytophagales bacterium]|nr:MAG: cobalamin-binding protein [Cytophagales bacterium]
MKNISHRALPDFPQRVVSLVPSQTELLYYWGLGHRVVGLTKFCIHPKEAKKEATVIGGTKNFHLARIRALQPDLIIGNKEENYEEGILALAKEFPLLMSDIYNLEDSLEMFRVLGGVLSVEEKAQTLIAQLLNLRSNYQTLKTTLGTLRVAYLIWHEPLMVAAKNTFIDCMLEEAGFKNVFSDLIRYPMLKITDLVATKPDVVMLSSEPFPFKAHHIDYYQKQLPQSKIIKVDGELFSWYGNRLLYSYPYFAALSERFAK